MEYLGYIPPETYKEALFLVNPKIFFVHVAQIDTR
jgi:hypothetical protein